MRGLRRVPAALLACGVVLSSGGALEAGEPSPGPLAHWKLDEAASAPTAVDETGNYDGTNSGVTTGVAARIGNGYDFDGTDDYVDAGDIDAMDTPGYFTVAMWFYRRTDGADASTHGVNNVLVAQSSAATNDNFELGTEGPNVEVYFDTTGGANDNISYDAGITDNTWFHIAVVYDQDAADGRAKVYVNGVLVTTSDAPSGTLDDSLASPLSLGIARAGTDNTGDFDGLMDDVRIYDRALTAVEICYLAVDLDSGLVVRYTFDNASNREEDTSGNGLDGTMMGGGDYTAGQTGDAIRLDADGEYMEVPGLAIAEGSPVTIACWVRHTADGGIQEYFRNDEPDESLQLRAETGQHRLDFYFSDTGGGHQHLRSADDSFTWAQMQRWNHLAATYDGTTMRLYLNGVEIASAPQTGVNRAVNLTSKLSWPGEQMKGMIDDFRIYSRALTAGEIYYLAGGLDSGLVAHWKLDEAAGATQADDATGNGNHGTPVEGATSGSAGRIDGAWDFDGDDYIVVPDTVINPLEGTISGWVNLHSLTSDWQDLFGTASSPCRYYLQVSSAGVATARILDPSFGTQTLIPGQWYHLAVTWVQNGPGILYVDGVEAGSTADVGATSAPLKSCIGSFEWQTANDNLNGLADDVRVYSRALSAAEMQQLFDRSSVEVDPVSGLVTTEDAASSSHSATFTVVLGTAPTADVTIDVSSSNTSEGVVDGATAGVLTLVFTPSDWDTPQTITVTGVDDAAHDGHVPYTLDLAVSSTDTAYQGRTRAVSATNRDDEIGTNLVAWWELDEAAGASTAVNSASPGTFDGTVSDPANMPGPGGPIGGAYNFGGDDRITTSMPGPHNTDLTWSAWIRTTTGGAIIANTNGTWTQGGKSLFVAGGTLELDVGWVGNLDTGFTVNDGAWHHVVLTVVDSGGTNDTVRIYVDAVERLSNTDFDFYSHDGTSLNMRIGDCPGMGDFFEGYIDDVRIYDRALSGPEVLGLYEQGLTMVRPTYGLVTNEDPAAADHTATFEVWLNSAPTDDVTISLSSSDEGEGTIQGAAGGPPAVLVLTFTPSGPSAWNVRQTVTVTGSDDDVADADAVYTIVLSSTSSADASFDGLDVADVSLTNINDDTPGISVAPTTALVTTEAGPGTATFTVVLACEPTDPVTVDVESSDTTEGAVSPAQLLFTAATWDTEQTVTVSGVDDLVDDGDIVYAVSFTVASAGAEYDGFPVPDIAATNIDDDTAGITVSAASVLTTSEGGGTATFTVVLASEPTADVTIAIQSSAPDEGTLSAAVLTFTASGATAWDTPHEVTVTGQDDDFGDGDIDYAVLFGRASSADGVYSGRQPADIAAINLDDEPVVTVAASPDTDSNEDGSGTDATFTVSLSHNDPGTVTIHFTTGGAATRGADYQLDAGGVLVPDADDQFDITGGATSIDVTVRAIDDDFGEGDEAVTFTVVHAPDDATYRYSVSGAGQASSTIIDDEPVVSVVASAPLASEPAVPGEFTVTRTTAFRPGDPFDIHYTLSGSATAGDDYIASPPSPVTILANEESATVTILPVDDRRQEGDETVTLAIVRNGALGYAVGAPGAASVTIADDERPGIGGGTGCAAVPVPAGGAGAAWGLACLLAAALVRRRAGRAGAPG